MCGIAGLSLTEPTSPAAATLDRLAAALAHRGPDGQGRHTAPGIGLVQTRLAIIDLVTGDQPIRDPAGPVLAANGEIYNYLELRAGLPDQTWRTKSDCEPPLALYRRDGLAFAESLRGMYAIAIHDPARDRLVLARDPFGIKPLYVATTAGGLAFASEPQALIAAGLVSPKLEAASRDALLQLQFVPGSATLLAGVTRVLPGESLAIERGRIVERRHRPALPEGGPIRIAAEATIGQLDAVLAESVELHQRSDVPYGLFLSGGIDSAAILALMSRGGRRVRAFTAAFPDSAARDERALARTLAKRTGAEHVEVEVTARDFWADLPRIAAAMDDPGADYATIPTWKLAREAARGLKVVLSGEGGDEIFAGYGRYRTARRPLLLGGRKMRASGSFDGLDVLRSPPRRWREELGRIEEHEARGGRSRLQAAQATDIAGWLPADLLTKLDRCLMAHGLEGRTPFLDPVVAGYAFRLPDAVKVRGRLGKWLLREWLNRNLPEAEPFSKKRGFTVPVGEWIGREPRLGPLLARQPGIAEIAHPERVVALTRATADKRAGFAAWTLLFYALWHRRHILGLAPEGDVLSCLEATPA
ncbi:MAG: asparagine synthase (glutamine-hydrolyzing) [Alphaproteobacteria bacterium]|nr:asparagine synthase (glutamine-hydrolyzing) [Alphaproteobacteria bacterium]